MALADKCPRCGSTSISTRGGVKMCNNCPATWNHAEQSWSTRKYADAKRLRDEEAKKLRAEGWRVTTKKFNFTTQGGGVLYSLAATKIIERQAV